MREILFRGKRLDNGKWYFGSYLFLHVPDHDWTGARRGPEEDVHFIIDKSDLNIAVDPATIGQYTGLTDKNGVKIFDGDLLAPEKEDQHAFVYLVLFANGEFCIEDIMLYSDDYGDYSGELTPISVFLDECVPMEVVGNIHDNPDVQLHRVHVIGNIHDRWREARHD